MAELIVALTAALVATWLWGRHQSRRRHRAEAQRDRLRTELELAEAAAKKLEDIRAQSEMQKAKLTETLRDIDSAEMEELASMVDEL